MTEGPILHVLIFMAIILRLVIGHVALTNKYCREVEILLKSKVEKKVNMLFSVKSIVLLIKYNLKLNNFLISMANVKSQVDFLTC